MSSRDLSTGLRTLGLDISSKQLQKLQEFISLLLRWNKVYNLTAIRDKNQVVQLHILDSLTVASLLKGKNCLDVGSGGGLPGIPLAICQPERQFTLLDTVGKKTRFMQQAVIELGLENVTVVQDRAENWSPEIKFDAIISRAFASLRDFVTLTARHLNRDGRFYAMKGRHPTQELRELPQSFQVIKDIELKIPQLEGVERYLIEIKKDG